MTMDCAAIRQSLGAWLDEQLSPSDAEEVRRHVDGCASCLEEKARLERLQLSLRRVLEARAATISFEPFWREVRRRIAERRPWHLRLSERIRDAVPAQRLSWAIPGIILFLLGLLYLEPYLRDPSKGNQAAVESIDGHGFNVAVFRETKTKTTVIWLFQHEARDEPSEKESPGEPSF